ncbi:hypothetical protein A5768_26135 [Mycolicibacterium fortuitum]|uniref:hypothetical protein n=1 Tax=Mycolicibacterium fortuitum TaxID=1766 RepID=UPI0007EAAD11|nr:hypothetical protein [Mycolicibacterium fortuitum]OBG21585.1 hypothetical protein A5768_26135 [Mycolicibacterium fortuitum]
MNGDVLVLSTFQQVRFWGPLAYLTPPVLLFHVPLAATVLVVASYALRRRRGGLSERQRLQHLLLGLGVAVAIVAVGMRMFPGPILPFLLSAPGEAAGGNDASAADWIINLVGPLGIMLAAVGAYAIAVWGVGRDLAGRQTKHPTPNS